MSEPSGPMIAQWLRMAQMQHNLAQFVGHGRLLNLFFGSSQTDDWLPKYGHFKFWGGVVLQKNVYTWFTCGGNKLCVNSVQTKMHGLVPGLHGERFHVIIRKLVGRAQPVWNRLCQIWLHHVFPGGAEAHLSGLNKLFLGYLILSESVFWPVLPRP